MWRLFVLGCLPGLLTSFTNNSWYLQSWKTLLVLASVQKTSLKQAWALFSYLLQVKLSGYEASLSFMLLPSLVLKVLTHTHNYSKDCESVINNINMQVKSKFPPGESKWDFCTRQRRVEGNNDRIIGLANHQQWITFLPNVKHFLVCNYKYIWIYS